MVQGVHTLDDEPESSHSGSRVAADLTTAFYAEYVGEGAYDGLLYRVWGSQHPESNGYRLSGYIAPIE
ncbi:MAG: hypothetical protein R6U94_02330 [Nitriliruptoraceae bacterium]